VREREKEEESVVVKVGERESSGRIEKYIMTWREEEHLFFFF
jgi:hypothetical protein